MFQSLLFFVHAFTCLILIALVLVQQSKGAEMGTSFGAGGNQAIMNQGGDFLGQLTKYSAILFFVVCIALSSLSNRQMRKEQSLLPVMPGLPISQEALPVMPTEIPD